MSNRQLATRFGPLELRVLDALWARNGLPATVRDVMPAFGGTAYTSVMTTMDRLFQKGVLSRSKVSRAFEYRVNLSRDEQVLSVATSALSAMLPGDRESAAPILARFVDLVAACDAQLLDDLGDMVHERLERLRSRSSEHS